MTRMPYRCLAAVSALVLVAFLVRAVSLDTQSLWRDEVDALRFATAPWSEMLGNFTRPGWNGPLYYVLLRGWIALAGRSEYAMRFFSLLTGVLCVPLIYALGRRLCSSWVAVTSALLVTTSPYLVWYSQEVKMYTLVLALALLAIYSLRRAIEGGRWPWWVIQVLATSFAFYSHILAALLIPVQVLVYFAWWPMAHKRWRGALVSLACLTLPYLPLAVWQAPLALQTRETGFSRYSLGQMIKILLNGWATGVQGWGGPWGPALLGVLAALELLSQIAYALPPLIRALMRPVVSSASGSPVPALASRVFSAAFSGGAENWWERPKGQADRNGQLGLLIWLSVPLLCVWIISLRQPLFTDRYLIWSVPAFYLLVALALASFAMAEHWTRWVVVPLLGAILTVNGVNLWMQASSPIKSDFRAAAAYVAGYRAPATGTPSPVSEGESGCTVYMPITMASQSSPEDLIIFQIPHGRYTFDYYFPIEEYAHANGLYTNHRTPSEGYQMGEEQAARQMREMTRGYDVAWLVATEVSMWDERNLVQQWLDEHAERAAEAHFKRVDVYRYELPDT